MRHTASKVGLASSVMIGLSVAAWAHSEPFSLQTPASLVEVKSIAEPLCGSSSYDTQCSVLSIAGKRVAVNTYVSVPVVLPDQAHPSVLVAEVSSGGNCCPPTNT